jgi:2'-5' RNA ligase
VTAAAARLRLFFALWPDAATRATLAAYAAAAHARCGGRIMRPQNLHFTLAFLGDTDAGRLDSLRAAATAVAPRRFAIEVDRVAYWRHNRIVWAGAAVVPEALAGLVADLRAALDVAGFRYDAKPFVPHVTLLRDARPAPLPALASTAWPVDRFVLVKSVPGQDYANVGEWGVSPAG